VESHPFDCAQGRLFRKEREGMGTRNSTSSRECLSGFVALHADMGSFGCVIVRVADDNFAQDDRWGGVVDFMSSKGARDMGHQSVV
jgi:hypothetical protein